jgi:nucleotide-binding universal stress UspA family protein
MKKILIPVDGSEQSKKALAEGRIMADAFGCQILLIHTVEGLNLPRSFNIAVPKIERGKGVYDENDMKEAEEMLQAYKETFGDKKGLVSTQVLQGFAADEIIKLLNESDVDMAILGSRGIGSPLYRNILGSVTNKVLHHAEKPILVVR